MLALACARCLVSGIAHQQWSDFWVVHHQAHFLSAATRFGNSPSPIQRIVERRDVDDRETTNNGLGLGELPQPRSAVRPNNGGLLPEQSPTCHPHSNFFGISNDAMRCFVRSRQITAKMIHRAIIEGNQVPRHNQILETHHFSIETPLTRTNSTGANATLSYHLPGEAQTLSHCNKSRSTNTRS